MLVRALALIVTWLVLATAILLVSGRRMRGPSLIGSLVLIGAIEAAGSLVAPLVGASRTEVVGVAIVSLVLGVGVIGAFPDWNPAGHAAWLFAAEAAGLYLIIAAIFIVLVPAGFLGLSLGLVLLAMQAAALLLALSYTYDMLDVICRRRWRHPEGRPARLAMMAPQEARATAHAAVSADPLQTEAPLVALHVPCHEEPLEVVERTLRSLARLDYPRERYRVFVVDNNTADPGLWHPLETLCDQLGFTFLHLEQWPGYKSGALNYALAATPLEYAVIGVIDADYVVEPTYLRDLVSHFEDPTVAFVQTPQDYRDYGPASTFYQRASYHAYRYFFDLSMPSRNERNAIIFCGTMGLIRAEALRRIGGWDEWCITEDAEASLRLLSRGYRGIFINRAYGRGLMPLEFDALKRQRFRWCFGGIQILRKHWSILMPWARQVGSPREWEAPGLTFSQRYHYLMGGLQWYSDALTFGFTALLEITGWLLVLTHPAYLPALGGPLLVLPLTFWVTSLLRTLWGLRVTRRCTWAEAFGAVGILWSLGWVVTLACFQGIFRRQGVFLRTPKAGRAGVLRALRSTVAETTIGLSCWALGVALLAPRVAQRFTVPQHGGASLMASGALGFGQPWELIGLAGASASAALLGVLACLQGIPYLMAPVLCLLSLRTEATAREVRRRALGSGTGEGLVERQLVAGALAAAITLAVLLFAANLTPQASAPPSPARQHVLKQLLGGSKPVVPPAHLTPTAPASPSPQATPGPLTPTPPASPSPQGSATPAPSPSVTGTATPLPSATPSPQTTSGPTPIPTSIPTATP